MENNAQFAAQIAEMLMTGTKSKAEMLMDEFNSIITNPALSATDIVLMQTRLKEESLRRACELGVQWMIREGYTEEKAREAMREFMHSADNPLGSCV